MKVTKEWLIETINKIPDNTEMEITGHDYSLFVKLDPNYKAPERAPFPPVNITKCKINGNHMWGFHQCRHRGDEWPEPYLSERKIIEGY